MPAFCGSARTARAVEEFGAARSGWEGGINGGRRDKIRAVGRETRIEAVSGLVKVVFGMEAAPCKN
jgi:hypothetical protein